MWTPKVKQAKFLVSPAYECGFGGAKGPGKTDSLIVDAVNPDQIKYPNYKAIIFRRTHKQLEEIYLRTVRWFSKDATWKDKKHCWEFHNGAHLYLSHCQHEADKYDHQGQEYHWMGFDQLETFTETMYEFLKMQVRSNDARIKCYIRATFNPGGIGHSWVKKRFVDACPHDGTVLFFANVDDEDSQVSVNHPDAVSRAFIFSTVMDNDHILKNDPMYVRNLKSLPLADRKAMLEGDWDSFQGQFFAEFSRPVHVVKYSLFGVMARELPTKRIISLDYGFKKPSSIHWHTLFPEDQIITYREFYKEGFTYEKLADKILELTGNESIEYMVCDPAIQGDKSHHSEVKDGDVKGESGYDIMKKICGKKFPVLLGDNRRVIGWTRMHQFLEPYVNQFGERTALWRITDNCKNLIRTLPAMIHDEHNVEDVDTDGEDHAPDECRYMIMSRPDNPLAKPKPLTPGQEFWGMVKEDLKKQNNSGHEEGEGYDIDDNGTEIDLSS